MSDAHEPHEAADFPEPPAVEDLDRLSVPAHVRTAPRFSRMVMTGVGAAIVLAAILAIVLPNSTGTGRFMVFVVLVLGLGLLGGLFGGLIAIRLDRPAGPQGSAQDRSTDAR
ncbi:hypothetical protein [Demequina pelophila]|uniref:hypothetical protein n=1 Tax=Demequina pelophila TaxID=1638984 RepID=UPI0007849816|nr:hypothetical protein [Demequina pelophila]